MAKPDDRSDNVAKLQEAVQNTIENLEESEHYLDEHSEELNPQEADVLTAKNEGRRNAIQSMRSEIEDEKNANS
ncbi:small acid-soluble spore protein Tlp [Cohnella cholangitidis]|jgi:small acid-soluble spore protein (thioredoxin-like protein)|uniref:Small acid-soluble spore protein Tlp n=1 Tax=Cohnella cholangitidis TaxID=2598458 RepID=A0A7G5C5V0_9BACL|nr:small acid-soluble spore protein Tlp [Cohnella cholangitidis]QMV44584.1 small acid-soluble spore protein Tlp [Cohnella cholangitidis]